MDEIKIKQCVRCKKWYEANTKNFNVDKTKEFGLKGTCKNCLNKIQRPLIEVSAPPPEDPNFRVCKTCKRRLPKTIEYFHIHNRTKGGLSRICRYCNNLKTKEQKKNNPSVYLESGKRYREKNRDKIRARGHRPYDSDKYTPEERKIILKSNSMKCNYGITLEEYLEASKEQDNRCWICEKSKEEISGIRKTLCVDHDHACCPGTKSCGECLRGLICGHCNKLLGLASDKIEVLLKAIEYLKNPPGILKKGKLNDSV